MARAIGCAISLLIMLSLGFAVRAENFYVGPKECEDCHQAEIPVWEGTKHFTGYKKAHKRPEAKDILKALGEKSMKRSPSCSLCHYTMVQTEAGGKARAKAGVSCEVTITRVKGPTSCWISI